ncbi:MAG: ATP-binding cassette domain-containing protein [Methylobacter sp.]
MLLRWFPSSSSRRYTQVCKSTSFRQGLPESRAQGCECSSLGNSRVARLTASLDIAIHGFSATAPASPKAPTVGALPPASMQSSAASYVNSLIEFNNVSKSYDKRQVLSVINLHIAAGEKIALIGESGAGKTTLLNLLLGFEAATEGQVLLNGQTVNRDSAAKAIAWVGQNAYIFHGSIKDNIALSDPGASEQRIADAAQAAGVTEFSEQLPEGLLTQVGERGYGLSGGQVQRIALARAFLKNADIVLLDEPTANLDAANKALLLDVIDRLFAKKTLIIASHDREVVQRMDRRIELQQGRLVL